MSLQVSGNEDFTIVLCQHNMCHIRILGKGSVIRLLSI